MKKISAFILCAVMAAAFAGCGSQPAVSSETTAAEEETTQHETLADDVKNQLDEALANINFDGIVQITRGGEAIYQYVKGSDDNGQPLTIDASLPVGSVSKQFCAASVMLLCDQNKLSVDETIDKYFPDYKHGKKITIKNLLNMSSGIPEYFALFMDAESLGADEAENIKIIEDMLFAEELDFEPGDDYEYSNSNYLLLSEIVEQVSGVPYHDYIKTNFLKPLGMTSTGFVEEITGDYEWTSALSKTELMNETTSPGLAKGAGDIVTNAADMDKWMHGLSSGKVISTDAFRQMTENVNPNSFEDYSYGLWKMAYDGVGHAGRIPPHFGALDYFNTERDVYLFAATNTPPGMSFIEDIPQTLLDILLENE